LGYHKLSEYDGKYFGKFFDSLTAIPISDEIIKGSIRLRQQHKINLGDSLIAATAIEYDLALVTNNSKDFKWINTLTLIDPFSDL
jgi:predicted nucleic acid-binding protein